MLAATWVASIATPSSPRLHCPPYGGHRPSSLPTHRATKMGKGLRRIIGKTASSKPKTVMTKKITSAGLAQAIAKKQYTDNRSKIQDYLKAKPHAAVKILHLFETGVFDDTPKTDMIPQSTNKFRLLSFPLLKTLAEAITTTCSDDVKQQVGGLKLKSEALKVVQFFCGVCDTCAIPSRNIDRLSAIMQERVTKHSDRMHRFKLVSNGKDGKQAGLAFDDSIGVFEFADWDATTMKWQHLVHKDSKVTVDIPDDMVVGKHHKIIDNYSEFAAKIKGRRTEPILELFNKAAEKDQPMFDFDLPSNDDAIAERGGLNVNDEAAAKSKKTALASASSTPAGRALRPRQSDESVSSMPPPRGPGGAKKPREA